MINLRKSILVRRSKRFQLVVDSGRINRLFDCLVQVQNSGNDLCNGRNDFHTTGCSNGQLSLIIYIFLGLK